LTKLQKELKKYTDIYKRIVSKGIENPSDITLIYETLKQILEDWGENIDREGNLSNN
jgi:hypothetical protein